MTVLLRAATKAPDDTLTPSIPMLAEIQHRIAASPWVLPVVLDAATYKAAEDEMMAVLKSRGYSDMARANIPQRNFIFYGVPVVLAD